MLDIKRSLTKRALHEEEEIPVFEIRPPSGWLGIDLRELWQYRELVYMLMWRDITVRYKQTAIGVAWVIIQPFMAMVVFSLFFGRLMNTPSEGLPYPIFVYAGLVPWQFFAKAITEASTSLVANQQMIKKVYFPRLLVPVAVVLAGLLDFGIAFLVLLGMMAFYGFMPSWTILAVPLLLLPTLVTALGMSLWVSALDARYRDVRNTLPFVIQLWLFATPVVYPSTIVPQSWRVLYGLNPMVGVIEGFRWALLGAKPPDLATLFASSVVVTLMFVGSLIYFHHTDDTLADVL